jgi:invasion protein IalB
VSNAESHILTWRFEMSFLRLLVLTAPFAVTSVPQTALAADPPLTSRAIDPTLFRDGAVKRFSGVFEDWSYVCDDVAGLKQRFCSLRSQVMDETGTQVALLVISTGEDGRPAALLKLKANTFSPSGIEVVTVLKSAPPPASKSPASKSGTKAPGAEKAVAPAMSVKVYPAACDASICQLIWTLDAAQVAALRAGTGWRLRGKPLDVAVSGLGFAAAVDASLKPRLSDTADQPSRQ